MKKELLEKMWQNKRDCVKLSKKIKNGRCDESENMLEILKVLASVIEMQEEFYKKLEGMEHDIDLKKDKFISD